MFAGSDTAVQLIQGSLNVAAYAGTQGLIPGVCFQFTPTYEVLSAWSDPSILSNMYAGRQQRSSKGILHVLKNNKISSPDCIMQRILWIMSDLVNFGDIQLITSNSMYRI